MAPWKETLLKQQPYDTRLGSDIIWEITQEATVTPPPSQKVVDALVAAQCPMIPSLSEQLIVGPPKCDDTMGYWDEPQGQNVLRWQESGDAGNFVSFGLDGQAGVNGSVNFATLEYRRNLFEDIWDVRTCQGMPLWQIKQSITKIEKMGQGRSTSITSDSSLKKVAYFVQYTISYANGTKAAQTDLMKLGADAVNITSLSRSTPNQLIAQAVRKGRWKGQGWTNCTADKNKRSWEITFVGDVTDVDMAATAADVRVVSAATITLMAILDGRRLPDAALPEKGMVKELSWYLVQVVLFFFILILIPLLAVWVCHSQTYGDSLRVSCLKIQLFLLPRDKPKQRPVYLPPTY